MKVLQRKGDAYKVTKLLSNRNIKIFYKKENVKNNIYSEFRSALRFFKFKIFTMKSRFIKLVFKFNFTTFYFYTVISIYVNYKKFRK